MIPKKSNLLYRELAEEMNIPVELVEDLIQTFYKEIRSSLTNLKHPRINVEGLGLFEARPSMVKKSIDRYKKGLVSHDTSTFKAYYNKKMLEDKVEALEKLSQKIDKDALEKEIFKKKKDEKYIKTNLAEPESDN